jgi:Mn2+/Fe2+ NRAMP family transporter
MGRFASGPLLKGVAWLTAFAIMGLNAWLLIGTFREWLA